MPANRPYTRQDITPDNLPTIDDYILLDHCPDIRQDQGQVVLSDPDGFTEDIRLDFNL